MVKRLLVIAIVIICGVLAAAACGPTSTACPTAVPPPIVLVTVVTMPPIVITATPEPPTFTPTPIPPTATNTPSPDELEEDATAWGVFLEKLPRGSLANADMPSASGRTLRCSIEGGEWYSNVHCYRNLEVDPSDNAFALSLSFWFSPTTTCNNVGSDSIVQAIEFSLSKWQKAKRYELAVQWENVAENLGDGAPQWRYWDANNDNQWVPIDPKISQCLQANRWHTLRLEGKIENGQVHYQGLVIDDWKYYLDLTTLPADALGESDRVAVAVQVDGNLFQNPYDLFIDQVKFTSWYVTPEPTLTPTPTLTSKPKPRPTRTPTPPPCPQAKITVPTAGSTDVARNTKIKWNAPACKMNVQLYQGGKLLRENQAGDQSGTVDLTSASPGPVEIKIWVPGSSSPSDVISVTVK